MWIGFRYFLGKKAKQNKKANPKIQQTITPQPPKKPMGNKAMILPKMPPMNNL